MKRNISILLIVILSLGILVGCGNKDVTEESNIIKIGVSPNPHGQIIEQIVEDLKEEGIEVKIEIFTDYVTPNIALDDGDLHANYFQHGPYLEDFIQEQGVDLVPIADVHIEPMAIFSDSIDSLDNLEDGSVIAIPNDTVNGGRALLLLEAQGLIKMDKEAGIKASVRDIVENPRNFEFKELEAATIPRVLDEVHIACINGNYALDSGLNPVSDSIAIEDSNSPYTNIIAVRTEDKDNENFQKLIKALHSDKVRDYINETFDGAVIPAF